MARMRLGRAPLAALELSDEDLCRLARELAPLVAAALPRDVPAGWMDAKTAASYAGCSVTSLHKAMAAREIEFRQDTKGGKAWFQRSWIDSWRGL